MHVVYLVYSYAPDLRTPEELLERYATVREWSGALTAGGAQVTVVQRFSRDADLRQDGVDYCFVRDGCSPRLRPWENPRPCHQAVVRVLRHGSVVHLNGMLFPLQLRALRTQLPAAIPVVVQHHAERPWNGVRKLVQRAGLATADAFLFAAAELAQPWSSAGLIAPAQPVYQVMETAIRFRRRDRQAARAHTGIIGDPVVLWVGRLNAGKDPLTVLDGFERILSDLPGARLYMVYSEAPLLEAVRMRIAACLALRSAVVLLGARPHSQMEAIYNSADYFVLGSRHEGSGYALVEAMSCGVVPVVTDIPSFRAITGDAEGRLWRVNDAGDFVRAFLQARQRPLALESNRVLARFAQHLGPAAVARQAIAAYDEIGQRRRSCA